MTRKTLEQIANAIGVTAASYPNDSTLEEAIIASLNSHANAPHVIDGLES